MHAFSYSKAAVKQNKINVFTSCSVLKTDFYKDFFLTSF